MCDAYPVAENNIAVLSHKPEVVKIPLFNGILTHLHKSLDAITPRFLLTSQCIEDSKKLVTVAVLGKGARLNELLETVQNVLCNTHSDNLGNIKIVAYVAETDVIIIEKIIYKFKDRFYMELIKGVLEVIIPSPPYLRPQLSFLNYIYALSYCRNKSTYVLTINDGSLNDENYMDKIIQFTETTNPVWLATEFEMKNGNAHLFQQTTILDLITLMEMSSKVKSMTFNLLMHKFIYINSCGNNMTKQIPFSCEINKTNIDIKFKRQITFVNKFEIVEKDNNKVINGIVIDHVNPEIYEITCSCNSCPPDLDSMKEMYNGKHHYLVTNPRNGTAYTFSFKAPEYIVAVNMLAGEEKSDKRMFQNGTELLFQQYASTQFNKVLKVKLPGNIFYRPEIVEAVTGIQVRLNTIEQLDIYIRAMQIWSSGQHIVPSKPKSIKEFQTHPFHPETPLNKYNATEC